MVLFVGPTEVGAGVVLALGFWLSSTANLILLPVGADASLINFLSGACVLLPAGVVVLLMAVLTADVLLLTVLTTDELLLAVLTADVLAPTVLRADVPPLAALTAVTVLALAVVG